MSRMLLSAYTDRPDWKLWVNQEILDSLSALEKYLLDKVDLVQMPGKRVRTVPVLIMPCIKDAMDLLVKERDNHFLFPDNPNFFATTATDGYLDSCKIMRQMTNLAKLDRPELITSTSLRKYVATVIQVLSLTSGELEWVCNHLGHNVEIDRNFYRQHPGVIEITKLSKLMIAVDRGDLSKFQNKNLNDVEVDIESDNESDDHVTASPICTSKKPSKRKTTETRDKSDISVQSKAADDQTATCSSKPTDVKMTKSKPEQSLDTEESVAAIEPKAASTSTTKYMAEIAVEYEESDDDWVSEVIQQPERKILRKSAKSSKVKPIDSGSRSDINFAKKQRVELGSDDSSSSEADEPNLDFKKKNRPSVRKPWSENELRLIRTTFREYFKWRRPPTFPAIDEAMENHPELAARTRAQIKTRVWHMIQTGR